MTTTAEFLGRGWSFPVVPDPTNGKLRYEQSFAKVRQSIRIILETEPNERLMRPTFGCGLNRYLMKPNTVATRALIGRDVERALREAEPRIELRAVQVEPGDDPALVLIGISYIHVFGGREENLVYPFYLE